MSVSFAAAVARVSSWTGRVVTCVGLLAVATALAWAVDGAVSLASQALIYLLPVVLTAVFLRGADAVATAVAGGLLLNYFFIPPRYTFEVEGPEYLISLAALLAVSLVVSGLVTRLKRETAAARASEKRIGELHDLGQALAAVESEREIAAVGAAAVARSFDCAAQVRAAGADEVEVVEVATRPDTTFQFDDDALRWVRQHGEALGAGTRNWPALPGCALPLRIGDDCIGVVGVDLRARKAPWQVDDVRHLDALARLAAAALQRLRLAQAARDAQAQAQWEGTRNALLASIAHDLRTPLAVIVGSASTLREQGAELDAERRAALLRTIESEATTMADTADNALQLARLSAGELALRRDWESLEEIVGSVLARLRGRHPARRLAAQVPAGLPLVQVDPVLIAQVLTNLIENALAHGGDGAVEIEVQRREAALAVSVRDRGPGLGRRDLDQLIRSAARAPQARAERGRRGAGLGLAISRAIVAAHGGTLGATEREGGGATFWFTLPVAREAAQPVADERAER